MGMYDVVICEVPYPPDLQYSMPQDYEWQTKDLECTLSRLYMRADGSLERQDTAWKKSNKGLFGGYLAPTGTFTKLDDFHGDIKLFGVLAIEKENVRVSIELEARFTEGKLSRFRTLECRETSQNSGNTNVAKVFPEVTRMEDKPADEDSK